MSGVKRFRIWWMNMATAKKERWWEDYRADWIPDKEVAARIMDEETALVFAQSLAERHNDRNDPALHRRVLDVEMVDEA